MKTRRVLALLLAVATLSGSVASVSLAAEVTAEQREALQLKVEELRARLALTPEQEARIAPLVEARNRKLQALSASNSSTASRRERIGMLKQARAIQEDFVEQVDPLLTPSQKKEWEAFRKEMKDAAKERRRSR